MKKSLILLVLPVLLLAGCDKGNDNTNNGGLVPSGGKEMALKDCATQLESTVNNMDTLNAISVTAKDLTMRIVETTSATVTTGSETTSVGNLVATIDVKDLDFTAKVIGLTEAQAITDIDAFVEASVKAEVGNVGTGDYESYTTENMNFDMKGGVYIDNGVQYLDLSNQQLSSIVGITAGKYYVQIPEGLLQFPILQDGMFTDIASQIVSTVKEYENYANDFIKCSSYADSSYSIAIEVTPEKISALLDKVFAESIKGEELTSEQLAEINKSYQEEKGAIMATLAECGFKYVKAGVVFDKTGIKKISYDIDAGMVSYSKSDSSDGSTYYEAAISQKINGKGTINFAYGNDVKITLPSDLSTYTQLEA